MQPICFYVKSSISLEKLTNLAKGITVSSKTFVQTSHEKRTISDNFIETMWPKATLMTISYIREH